ncbi:MAG: hypothetical protein RL660_1603, partial [Bacteroidota bacterium]
AAALKSKTSAHKSHGLAITRSRMLSTDERNSIVVHDKVDAQKNPLGTTVTLIIYN